MAANRYAVPMNELDRAQVLVAQQVQEQACVAVPPDAALWGGALPSAYGTAAGGGAGGCDGGGCD
jgi:hypothetical protein